MHYLDESAILTFLIQFGILLGLARGLGMVFQRFGQPAITAEILVGVICGPTLFGRLAPGMQAWVFPDSPVQHYMLDTVAWLGILFFLLETGMDTDLRAAWRQRRDALMIAASDLLVPLAMGVLPCLFVPDGYLADPDRRVLFAFFIGTILTISALPVTARVLQDLGIYRTDAGVLIMGALTINDVVGWVLFAIILSFAGEAGIPLGQIPIVIGATLLFAGFSLTAGTRLTDKLLGACQRRDLPEPGTSLTITCLLAVIGGAITLWIGIHALFGFFIVGIMTGECRNLSANTRNMVTQTVRAVMVPIFFATIGLKIDFFANFDLAAVLFVTILGIAARYWGALLGVRLTGRHRVMRHLISAAHTPGGEMQIVIGMLALEFGVITQTVFVAIVCGAILSSVILGPWMRWAMKRQQQRQPLDYFSPGAFIAELDARQRDQVVREMCDALCEASPGLSAEAVTARVLEREELMSTGMEHGVAIPHARLTEVVAPLICVGRSHHGIPWNTPDGQNVNLVFLLLTPAEDTSVQLRILRAVSSAMQNPLTRQAMLDAPDDLQMWQVLSDHLSRVENVSRPA